MGGSTQKIILVLVAGGLVVLLGWAAFHSSGNPVDAAPQTVSALCDNPKCAFSGTVERKKLAFDASAGKRPAASPLAGPGYKCPKCGQNTLYTDPMKCPGCGTFYLSHRDASGQVVNSCPKCGKG